MMTPILAKILAAIRDNWFEIVSAIRYILLAGALFIASVFSIAALRGCALNNSLGF